MPRSIGGNTRWSTSAGRVLPCQVTRSCRISAANRSSFSSNSSSYWLSSYPNKGKDSVNEPRPRMTSARPFDAASSVANRWTTRTGSSELSTVTAEPRRMRLVRPAIAASTTSGAETAKSARWCSPTPKKSTPSVSASTASSMTSRMTCACGSELAVGPRGDVAERIQPELEMRCHQVLCSRELSKGIVKGNDRKRNCQVGIIACRRVRDASAGREIVFPRAGDRCLRARPTQRARESGTVRKSMPVWPIGYSVARGLAAYCLLSSSRGGASCGNSCLQRLP